MSSRLPTRISTLERTISSIPIKMYRPTTSRVSISRVVTLLLTNARSYTCSMYTAGVSISKLITPLKAARA
ncbi:hypothetical protein D3C72_2395970 [compost metagenome]